MFSALSGWMTSAADAVNKISGQGLDAVRQTGLIDALQCTTAQPGTSEAASAVQQLTLKDFMTPPAAWTGSSDEWQWCMKAALNDANTCAIKPDTMKSDDSLWQQIHSLVTDLPKGAVAPEADRSANVLDLLNKIEASYTPAADLVAFIQAHIDIYTVRSYVVPLFTSDGNYWLNLGWRLSLYRLCTNAGDMLQVMQTLSKLPASLHDIADAAKRAAEAADARFAARAQQQTLHDGEDEDDVHKDEDEDVHYVERPHLTDNSEYWNEKRQQYDAMQEKLAWLRETQERVEKEIELARGNVKLLESLLQRQEASSALGVSVWDSCKYHKVKLSRLIGDISAAPNENTKGTVLDSESGLLFHQLFQCNEDVKNVLHACAARSSDVGGSPKAQSPPVSPATSTLPPRASSTTTSTVANGVSASSPAQAAEAYVSTSSKAQSVASNSAVELSAAGNASHTPAAAQKKDSGDDDDDESFEAKLPWAMDD